MEDPVLIIVTENMSMPDRCADRIGDFDYDIATSVVCTICLVFGIVYVFFGYRCFKVTMFLTGFMFASVIIYVACQEESLLSPHANIGVSLGAGVLFGLITMLVSYVGLFMTGVHLGLLLGLVVLVVLEQWYHPTTLWVPLGILFGLALIFALVILKFPKGCTIISTSLFGGGLVASAVDYFVEKLAMLEYIWDRLRVVESDAPCWYSWLIMAVWPFMLLVGLFVQWRITGRDYDHREALHLRGHKRLNLKRVRDKTDKSSENQSAYRYYYQVRRANGDVIAKSYINTWKNSPQSTLQSDAPSEQTPTSNITLLNPSDSTNTTMTQVQ